MAIAKGMLSAYRVLDLTNQNGYLCGKMLGDMGADVIKIENPRGDSGRKMGPFYQQIPDQEKSLYWFAYNLNKRGITLDIETADGRQILSRLVKKADFIIESFDPGYLDSQTFRDSQKLCPIFDKSASKLSKTSFITFSFSS